MLNLLIALFGVRQNALNQARRIHARASMFLILICLIILTVPYGLNIIGLGWLSVILGIFFSVAGIIILTMPTNLLGVGTLGYIRGKIADTFRVYARASGYAMMIASAIFLISGLKFISYKQSPGSYPTALLACIIIGIVSILTGKETVLLKWMRGIGIFVLTISVIAVISDSMVKKITGYDLNFLSSTESELATDEAAKAFEKRQDDLDIERLEYVGHKLDKGEKLEPDEREFLERKMAERKNNSLFGRLTKKSEEVFSEIKDYRTRETNDRVVVETVYIQEKDSSPEIQQANYTPPVPSEITSWDKFVSMNEWTEENLGAKKIFTAPKTAKYRFQISGDNIQYFVNEDGTPNYEHIPPKGLEGRVPENSNLFPRPDKPIGMFLIRLNNSEYIPAGNHWEGIIPEGTDVYATTNIGQEKSDHGGPKNNFILNKGGFGVKIDIVS